MATALSVATKGDADTLFALINEAYEVESGDTGVSFKKTKRFMGMDELMPCIDEKRCIVARESGSDKILGAIVWEESKDEDGNTSLHFGPFAVSPAAQGRGVGRALLDAVEALAASRGCAYVKIEVVNHRSDLLGPTNIYEKRGFTVYGEAPFPAPERCTRPCHFVLMRKPAVPAKASS